VIPTGFNVRRVKLTGNNSNRNGLHPILTLGAIRGGYHSAYWSPRVRVGFGHDTHRLGEGRPLILGGLTIAHTRGLIGHSDADVVCHAVADALLGAAGLGDIGELYPDTDPKWKGADSTRLLAEVIARVEQSGWQTVNCDLVIHAQEPKLGPHKPAIRANLARILHVDETAINVKAKTGEHVGPIGRAEAISCEAVVLLEPLAKARAAGSPEALR
jgi:2-C-methyl-D-erythritol 2,4-cyclodiphosphate synthase